MKIDLYNHLIFHCEHCPIKIKQELQQRHMNYQQQQHQQQHQNHLQNNNVVERQQQLLSSSSPSSSQKQKQKQKNKNKNIPISKEERLFFKKLWFRMGHKEHMQE